MSKRSAIKQLTQDNWDDDDDDEKETPGIYRTVRSSVLQSRVIKKAKRSLPQATEESSTLSSCSPFGQFRGFGTTAPKTPSFGFLQNPRVSSLARDGDVKEPGAKTNGLGTMKLPERSREPSSSASDYSSAVERKKCDSRDVGYYRQLKALNESLQKWINVHVSKNPCCDFTPVFADYKKHLNAIEQMYPLPVKPSSCLSKPLFKVPSAPVQKTCDTVSEGKLSHGEPSAKITKLEDSTFQNVDMADSTEMCYGAGFKSNTTNTSTFSSGIKASTTATVPSSNSGPTSSCSSSEKDTAENEQISPFTFAVAKSTDLPSEVDKLSWKSDTKPFTFSFKGLAKSNDFGSQPNDETNEDDDYVPPRNEVTVVKEDGAVYSKKCKLFYKKDGSYVEKGVGMLYLKPMGGNTQLLIRADTNLGNILLNIKLSSSLPVQRMGKNNVLVVCVPNPPLMPGDSESRETAPLLIRVKTSDDADELLDMLNKHRS